MRSNNLLREIAKLRKTLADQMDRELAGENLGTAMQEHPRSSSTA